MGTKQMALLCSKGARSVRSAPPVIGKPGERAQISSEDWLRKCNPVQAAHVSPEFLAQAKRKSERVLRMSKMSKKAGKLQKCNMLQQRAWMSELLEQLKVEPAEEE